MVQTGPGTVQWRAVMDLFECWQAASPAEQPACLVRLCTEHPDHAAALQALVAADAAADDCDLAMAALATRLGGMDVGAWRLDRLLGSGGMGEVWLARRNDGLHQGLAAIKLLPSHRRSALAQARFAAEAQLLARLSHPNIARLLDVGIGSGGQRHLVLEYVQGEPIDRWCETRGASVAARLQLFMQVCEAVSHAHAQLVVHRDLKPSNILVDDQGQAKLLDFGVAKLLDEEQAGLTRTGQLAMTPAYAAPEQLTGEPVTVAVDVYALGLLLFELLSGERLHAGSSASPLDRLREVLEVEPRLPSQSAPAARAAQLRGDLDHIVMRAVQRRPQDRYASVRALADDLQRHLGHQPVLATAPTWTYRAAKFVRRHRSGVAAATLVALALVGGTAAALWHAGRAQLAAQQAQAEAAKANATREFLLGLFRSVKVGQADLRASLERPTRELLLTGAEQLLADRTLAPATRLDLLRTIGQWHARLSLNDSADRLDQAALALTQDLYGTDSELTLAARVDRGHLLRQLGRYEQAMQLLAEVISANERAGRADSLLQARALHEFGDTAVHAGDARAQDFLTRAIETFVRVAPADPGRVSAQVTLMRWYRRAEDFSAFDREAARIAVLVNDGAAGPGFDRFYFARAVTARWLAAGAYAQAWATLAPAVAEAIESQGPRHPMVIVAQRHLALLEQQLGDRAAARRRLAALDVAVQDQAVWSAGEVDRSHADLDWFDGELLAARAAVLRSLARPQLDAEDQSEVLLRLARVESMLGLHDSAIAAARKGWAYFDKHPGAGSLLEVAARATLAEALWAAGRRDEAGARFESLRLWATQRGQPAAVPLVGRLEARALLGLSAQRRSIDPVESLRLADQALRGLAPHAAVLEDRLLWAAAHLAKARALQALGRTTEAAALAEVAALQLARDQSPGSPRLAEARALR